MDFSKPVHLIVNPRSGYGSGQYRLGDFRTAARGAGVDLVEYTTAGPGDAADRARQVRRDASAVVVWGGDGTANEVASGLTGSAVPMLACPVGTENLLAKELAMPGSPRRLVEVLGSGRIVACDVGIVNDRVFLLLIGVGFDGEVVRRLAAKRGGHISHLSYFWPLWRTFWEHDFPRLHVTADGETVFDDFGLAFVGNISRYAVGLRICRDAAIDDGLLDLVVFSCREQTRLMLHAAWTLLRRHPLKGDVIYRRVRAARIEARRPDGQTDRPVCTQVDGDVGPDTPLEIRLASGRVRLLVPPGRPDAPMSTTTADPTRKDFDDV
ncbi:MAG: NAD(+)/NADH kinase [Phycisphaerae bacterium]|nr:NAD(+)/NADH kinase [Phycisphaerae bacterium]